MDADDVVLVALLNQPRDLEIVRAEHWYRIPAKHAPAHLTQTRYVAFYLTRAFGERKWTIREYAPVRGHELVRRRDLFPAETDHPRANDAYYKLQLGSLIELAHPIVSRSGRRILFIWTTGDKFSRAVEINDLLGKSAADDALWDALKESGIRAERQIVVRDKRARYRVDFWIRCRRGNVAVVVSDAPRKLPKANWGKATRFSTEEIENDVQDCAWQVSRLARELGGIKYTAE
ncbi:MAG: hypothetical protein AB1817_07740 [Chloroflexota bacterium]